MLHRKMPSGTDVCTNITKVIISLYNSLYIKTFPLFILVTSLSETMVWMDWTKCRL